MTRCCCVSIVAMFEIFPRVVSPSALIRWRRITLIMSLQQTHNYRNAACLCNLPSDFWPSAGTVVVC